MAADQSSHPPGSRGPSLTRRNLLKTGAGAATAGAFLAADGPLDVESPVGDAQGIAITTAVTAGVMAGSALGWGFGVSLQDYDDVVDAQIDKSIAIAHESAVSEMQSYGMLETTYRNDLETTDTMAHMEARDAIATAWENGKSSGDAYMDAMGAIEQYYAERVENNWIIATAKSLTQQAYVFGAAIEAAVDGGASRDINGEAGGWALGVVEHPTHGVCSWSELLEERQDVDVELLDGSTVTVPMPDVLVEWDGAGISKQVNIVEFLRGWDDSAGNFGIQIDGERATWSGSLGIPSWSFTDEDGNTTDTLQPYTVLDLQDQYRSIRSAVENQSATVVGNYDQRFVEDLYVRLDDGEIEPHEIRGIDGQAEFLAGTTDASADSYRMALLQQLGMTQADMSKIASMTGTFTGFEGLNVQRDDSGNRAVYPGRAVDGAEYSGQLFARSIPSGGLNVGGTYAVDPIAYAGYDDNTVRAIDTSNGSVLWTFDKHTNTVESITISPDGSTIYSASSDQSVRAIDATTGGELWSYTGHTGKVYAVQCSPDGSTVYTGSADNSVHALDTTDGTQNWSYSHGDSVYHLSVTPDGSRAISGGYSGGIHAINTSDGTQNWAFTTSTSWTKGLGISPGGDTVYSCHGGGTVYAINRSDGTESWNTSVGSPNSLTVTPNGIIHVGDDSGNITGLDPADGSVANNSSAGSSYVVSLESSAGGGNLFAAVDSSGVYSVALDGGVSWSTSGAPTAITVSFNPSVRPDLSVAGTIYGGKFFDATTSETVNLQNGLLTLTSMTNQDGDPIETTSGEDWGEPDYDAMDLTIWRDYLKQAEDIRETIEQYIDETSPAAGGTSGSSLWDQFLTFLTNMVPFSGILQWVVIGLVALIGINIATSD